MKVLALETANEQCSVCIADENQELYFQLDARAKAQTQTILPLIEQGLAAVNIQLADLTAVAFSRGPGSFSGVRINAAVTQALAWANDLPVIPVSTLQALAQAACRTAGLTEVTAVLDARMQEVYWGEFEWRSGVPVALSEARVCPPEDVHVMTPGWLGLGTGFSAYAERFTQLDQAKLSIVDPNALPDARALLQLANVADREYAWHAAEAIEPIYLRNNVAQTIAEREAAKRDAS